MPRDQYQTVKEVADRLRVSEATVRGWIKDGELRAIEVGKGWRIADSDLDAFLCSHSTRAKDPAQHQDEVAEGDESEQDSKA